MRHKRAQGQNFGNIKNAATAYNVVVAFFLYPTNTNRIKIVGQLKPSGIFLLNLHK